MSQPPNSTDTRGRSIPWIIVGIFIAMTVLFAWFIRLAVQTDTGVVSDNAYQTGLRYNEVLAHADVADNIPWQLAVTHQNTGITARINLEFTQVTNAPFQFDAVRAWLIRPTQAGHDIILPLRQIHDGLYVAEFVLPAAGVWLLRVTAKQGMRQKQWQQEIIWPQT